MHGHQLYFTRTQTFITNYQYHIFFSEKHVPLLKISSHLPLWFFIHHTLEWTKSSLGPQDRKVCLGWWKRLSAPPSSPLALGPGCWQKRTVTALWSQVRIFPSGELSSGQCWRGEQLHLTASPEQSQTYHLSGQLSQERLGSQVRWCGEQARYSAPLLGTFRRNPRKRGREIPSLDIYSNFLQEISFSNTYSYFLSHNREQRKKFVQWLAPSHVVYETKGLEGRKGGMVFYSHF